MDPLGPVVITAREIYDQGRRVGDAVERILAQMTALQQDLSDHVATQGKINQDVETRLRKLESGRWPLPALSALLAIGSLAVAILAYLGGRV